MATMDPMKLRVVRVDPGQQPVDTLIPNNLQGLQDVVGGYLEPVHRVPMEVGRELVYYANEDGLRLGLAPNRRVGNFDVVGPVLVVAVSGNQEDSLSDHEVEMVVDQLRIPCPNCNDEYGAHGPDEPCVTTPTTAVGEGQLGS